MAEPSEKSGLTAVVAAAVVGLSLADAAYEPAVFSAATVVVWWGVVITLLLRVWPRERLPLIAVFAGLSLAALAALSFASLAWAGDDGRAFAEAVRAAGYTGLFALVALSATAAERRWLIGIAIGLALVGALGLLSRFESSLPGGDEELQRTLPAAMGRLSYPVGYWNGLGAAMAIGIVLLAWLGARAHGRGSRTLAIAALPICGLALYLTSSRGAVVAAAAGLVALVAVGPQRPRLLAGAALGLAGTGVLTLLASGRNDLLDALDTPAAAAQGDEMLVVLVLVCSAVALVRWLLDERLGRLVVRRGLVRLGLAAAAVGAVLALIAVDPARRWDQFNDAPETPETGFVTAHLTSGSGSGRYQFWDVALDGFAEDPLIGLGAGGYAHYWSQHATIDAAVRSAHSLYLETLAELGLAGLALLAAFLTLVLIAARNGLAVSAAARPLSGGAALAVLVTGLVSASFDWTWELPAVFGPVIVAAALLTVSAAPAPEPAAPSGSFQPPRPRWGAWGRVAVGMGIGFVALAGSLMLAELELSASRDAVDRGDLAAAEEDAGDARELQPWSAEPYAQLGLIRELQGELPEARGELVEAIERAPEDWRLWLIATRLASKQRLSEVALVALRRARELNPRLPLFRAEDPVQPPPAAP